jgi:hypothetical protein
VPHSVLEAIKQGLWDYEPPAVNGEHFDATQAVPGSNEKLAILAERLRQGLPLWHPGDVLDFEHLNGDGPD